VSTEYGVLEKAARLCLKNARQYIKDACTLYSFMSYGHALALTVLSDVELGKAVIYHLWSKDLISGNTLPAPFQAYFWEKKYELFASETWWVGLTIASNVEYLVQTLIDSSQGNEAEVGELSKSTIGQITEIYERMGSENGKLPEFEDCRDKGFFVNLDVHDSSIVSPDLVEKTLVKDRIKKAKQRIRVGTPFLSLSLNDTPKRITGLLLEEAFQSILPLRDRIRSFILPAKTL